MVILTKPSLSLTVYVVRLTVTTLPVDKCKSITGHHYKYLYSLIKLQLGADPDHNLVVKHVLVSSPHRTNSTSQVYVTVEPRVVFVKVTFPLAIAPGCPQLTTAVTQKIIL